MKEATHIKIAAQSLYAASNFNDWQLQSAVSQPANEHISTMLFESELYRQYQEGLISAYEYALNVHRIVMEIEQGIMECRHREEEAKKDMAQRAAQQAEKLSEPLEVIFVKI